MTIDEETVVEDPMSLQEWIDKNKEEIEEKGHKFLFGKKYQFEVCWRDWFPTQVIQTVIDKTILFACVKVLKTAYHSERPA